VKQAIHSEERDSRQVAGMFDRIAPAYDRLNRILSFGQDVFWRRRAARCLDLPANAQVLDLAVGTGDLLMAVLHAHPSVRGATGIDLSPAMLERCERKLVQRGLREKVTLQAGDAMNLPLEDSLFDGITMGFGIRNLSNRLKGLQEMHRVLKPGGTLAILEFAWPKTRWLRALYTIHLRLMVPVVGGLLSGHRGAYRYLNQTIEGFDRPAAFCSLMEQAGFHDVAVTLFSGGIVGLYRGRKD
jgi:demethylmenaquinone methyltransferase/2-methoxy-6-polyprenyl-1,4-benzoquinol methylase